jgi:hypothetical protein
MGGNFIKEFIECAGTALKEEDRSLVESGRRHGRPGGLLRAQQEKFYQYIVWKAACEKWPAEVEKDSHDLVFLDPTDGTKYLCVCEMKNWFSESGLKELPHIDRDVRIKLNQSICPDSVFLLFSANDRGHMDKQLQFFQQRVFADPSFQPTPETFCFETINPYNPPVLGEFWIACWPIKSGPFLSPP